MRWDSTEHEAEDTTFVCIFKGSFLFLENLLAFHHANKDTYTVKNCDQQCVKTQHPYVIYKHSIPDLDALSWYNDHLSSYGAIYIPVYTKLFRLVKATCHSDCQTMPSWHFSVQWHCHARYLPPTYPQPSNTPDHTINSNNNT